MVPRHLVPHNWSAFDWSLWTNGPQQIQSPWTNSPPKFGPHGQMVPNQFGPPWQMVPNQFGPHISRSSQPVPLDKQNKTEFLGTIFQGGTNWLGTICPWGPNFGGPFVHGDRIGWGLFVQRDQSIWDQLWGPNVFGTKCVTASMMFHKKNTWKTP